MPRGDLPRKTYLGVVQGKITQRLGTTDKRADVIDNDWLKKQHPTCTRVREIIRNDKFEKTVFEFASDYVEGIITAIELKDGDFGREIHINIDDENEMFKLQISADGSTGRAFMQIAPNIDPLSIVRFRPWSNGNGMTISQGGTALDFTWTKETPGDYPPPPEFAGEKDYKDWTRDEVDDYKVYKLTRDRFLQKYLTTVVMPKFKEDNVFEQQNEQGSVPELEKSDVKNEKPEDDLEQDDDLPF